MTGIEQPKDRISYTLTASSLGRVLIAWSERGVCAVLLGDDDTELLADLEHRFTGAALARAAEPDSALLDAVLASVEDSSVCFGGPLDLRGTPFQRRVWDELRAVPPTTTTTYAQIAGRIGAPSSVRAVASAIAANPVAVIVPCHRVIRSDGALSGYRWGVERKRALLERERKD